MYSKFLNKAGASLMAAAMLMNGMAVLNTGTAFAEGTTKYEFEDAKISGDVTVEKDSDVSGGKYLKMTDTGTIELNFSVENDGTYNLIIHCGGIGGAKQQNLYIDGVSQGALGIPERDDSDTTVKVSSVKLSKGEHTMLIEKSWGWSNFDYLEVEDASSVPIVATQTTPCDKNATAETKNLMSYLASIYGNNVLSGQQEIYMYGHGGNFEQEFEYLQDLTGKLPAIRGFDFLNCANILYGSEDGTVDRMIDWAKNKNGIVTASWHIVVPKHMAGYKVGDPVSYENSTYSVKDNSGNEASDFVTSNILKEGTVEREYYLTALGALAEQIQKLQDEGVPLIFRPLHEAEGGGGETGSWFWWGKEGSAVYKELWKLTYKTLTEDYNLHNIIWEWNSYNFTTSADWYPGDEYVDIIGYDKYNCTKYLEENNWLPSYVHDDSAISPVFYGIMEKYNNAKMVAMAENDCFSTVENLTSERAGWLYFCTWYDGGGQSDFLSDPLFNTKEDTIAMYQSDYCITLDELPADLYSSEAKPIQTNTTASTNSSTGSTTTTTATTASGDFTFELKKYNVEMEDGFGDTMTIKIKGTAGASIGGALGYSNGPTPDDWVNIEWKGNADKDGNLSVEIDTSEIPADVKTGEIQIWWSNVTGSDKKTKDVDCELVSYADKDVSGGEDDIVYGDTNCDGEVNISDVVLIMQSISNPSEFSVSEAGKKNANVINTDGLTNSDALAIQMVQAKLISAEDFPLTNEEFNNLVIQ